MGHAVSAVTPMRAEICTTSINVLQGLRLEEGNHHQEDQQLRKVKKKRERKMNSYM